MAKIVPLTRGDWCVRFNREGDFQGIYNEHDEVVVCADEFATLNAGYADLKAMAAVPELLDACKQSLCMLTGIDDWWEAMKEQAAYDECPYHGLAKAIEKAVLDAHRE